MLTMGQLGELRGEVARKILVDRVLTKSLESTKDAARQRELIKEATKRAAFEEDRRLQELQAQLRAKESRVTELESMLATAKRVAATAAPAGHATTKALRKKERARALERERQNDTTTQLKQELGKRTDELEALRKRLEASEQQVSAVGMKVDAIQAEEMRRSEAWRFVSRCVLLPSLVVTVLALLVVFAGRAQRPGLLAIGSLALALVVFLWSRWIHRIAEEKPALRESAVFRRTFLVARLLAGLLTLGGLSKHLLSHYIWEEYLKKFPAH